ncbi:MAG: sigma-70 family RNA polymerase sigma factor [Candidatus Gastranaerophilales bacterium]|nr:sigma-70 family RNA polymerase sigma factor [Candidatus Gastranaerophilales bacterium]MCM1073174.1 sigma-70 family RNA polymerase sigma factor [Bacteroides sp.]
MNFNELIKANKQNVKNIIRLITNQDNEDLEQEVYVKAWKNADKYEERGNFKSWINTIAKNVSKDYLKSAYFKNSINTTSDDVVLGSVKDAKSSPDTAVMASERQKRIISAIEELKPKLKETIMLCEINGYTYEDAAKKLNCPIGTIKSRIYNAKKELAIKLEDLL